MGLPITRHLIAKGFEVAAFDVQRSAVEAAVKLGAKSCATLRAVAAQSEVVLKSSASNWALETWLQPRPMPWAEKDMAIVLQEADNARLPMPLSGVIREVVKAIKIEKGAPMPKARK